MLTIPACAFSPHKIIALKAQHKESLNKSRFFRKMFGILFCLWLTQLACMFGALARGKRLGASATTS